MKCSKCGAWYTRRHRAIGLTIEQWWVKHLGYHTLVGETAELMRT